jgi:SAM-dependent methyltransferase
MKIDQLPEDTLPMSVGNVATANACELCGAELRLVRSDFPGYQMPHRFALYDCAACRTMVASPKAISAEVYEAIYRDPSAVAGYDRYAYFAKAVARAKAPLDFLAERGQMYWAVREFLKQRSPRRVLEIGSGLGYLTFALNKAGYAATGIDLSSEAVQAATARFGAHYVCSTLEDFGRAHPQRFDTIVMTEVIEHLVDPAATIEAAFALLEPGGSLFITTPNRSFGADEDVWRTELPPVHLWWFSEDSVRALAAKTGASVAFLDFAAYNAKYPPLVGFVGITEPSFDEAGRVVQRESTPIRALRKLGVLQDVYRYVSRAAGVAGVKGIVRDGGSRGFIIAAALTPVVAAP